MKQDLLTTWVHEHGKAVRGYLIGVVRRVDVADDLLQDVFRRAWQARDRYREQGAARAYLLKIADRLACNHLRRSHRELNLDEDGWTMSEPAAVVREPAAELVLAETREELAAALEALTPGQRRVLLLRYYSDLGFAEIASVMECPINTVLSHCRRGLIALRKSLVGSELAGSGGERVEKENESTVK